MPKRTPRPLTKAEIKRLAEILAVDLRSLKVTTRRDALAVVLALSGLRITEVTNLLRTDIRSAGLHVRTLKGGNHRTVPLNAHIRLELQRLPRRGQFKHLLQTATGHKLDARNLRRAWERIAARAQVNARFHDLRHTAACVAHEQTHGNIVLVSKLLGHKKVETTGWYLATMGRMQHAMVDMDLRPEASTRLRFEEAPTHYLDKPDDPLAAEDV